MKHVSNIQSTLVLGSPRHSIIARTSFPKFPFVFFLSAITMFITSCQKDELQSNSQKQDLLSSSQKQNVLTGSQKQEGKPKCVPFKASFSTIDELIGFGIPGNPNVQVDHLTGTGEGTHIGRATIDVHAEGDTTLPFPAPVTSTATFTAANGDKIFETGVGYVEVNFSNGDLHLTGPFTITGGTGRFAGATGNLAADVHGNIFSPKGTVTYTGTICY